MAEKLFTIAFLAAISLSGLAITAVTSGGHAAPAAVVLVQRG
jgi:hypothetical protein